MNGMRFFLPFQSFQPGARSLSLSLCLLGWGKLLWPNLTVLVNLFALVVLQLCYTSMIPYSMHS